MAMQEMTREEIYDWLREGAGWVHLATVGPGGAPHVVPLGYFVVGDDIVLNMRGQREANVRRDPRVSICVDGGDDWNELKGVIIQGEARLIEDYDGRLELTRISARQRGVPEDELPTEPRPGRSFARVTPTKFASWDNTKRRARSA